MKFPHVLIYLLLTSTFVQSQTKFDKSYQQKRQPNTTTVQLNTTQLNKFISSQPKTNASASVSLMKWQDLNLSVNQGVRSFINKKTFNNSGQLNWIEFEASSLIKNAKSNEGQLSATLSEFKSHFGLASVNDELLLVNTSRDDQGEIHSRLQQQYKSINVVGGELIAHTIEGIIGLINGQVHIINKMSTTPTISVEDAIGTIRTNRSDLIDITSNQLYLTGGQQFDSELVIYPHKGEIKLAWAISAYINLSERWQYFIDASTGQIIHSFINTCKFHNDHNHINHNTTSTYNVKALGGPETADEPDLNGQNARINVFEQNGTYFLLNVNEPMFNASSSSLPDEPVGGILTLDAGRTSPENENFSLDHITTNNNVWSAPTAVSAHQNAAIAYGYYRETFNLNSFDNAGKSIFSIVNVADGDGSGLDNAFWNGFAMFYGGGKEAFVKPLAASLDVAAHELTHAVIEHTANLTYQNESGALNESFADIFAVMIERQNWVLGEDVVNTSIFLTGALRDLSNPNNGGTQLGDTGWQPASVSEQFFGKEDNGGVHINSGITNHAYYLFATDDAVGVQVAEQVYFKALRDYLVSSSDFQDLRAAVGQSINDLFGSNVGIISASNRAFDAVGISERTSGGTQEPIEIFESNDGQDFVVWYDEANLNLMLRDLTNGSDDILSSKGVLNQPSVSDDGSIVLFVGSDRKIYAIVIDWNDGTFEEIVVGEQQSWRNAAISKDGSKIAAVSGILNDETFDNRILVVDLDSEQSQWFELYNPTSAEGINTGDVQFADALEWDHSSQFVMYDAFNRLQSLFGNPFEYWDIGFLRAWDNSTATFNDGEIFKLFPSLPEKLSVGNPSFSKNSPDIIAFDLIDERESESKFSIFGFNLETGDQALIFENNTAGYPNFSSSDDRVIFNFVQNSGDIIGQRSLAADLITGTGDATILFSDATWGAWLNNGNRELTTATSDELPPEVSQFLITPNPIGSILNIESKEIDCNPCLIKIMDAAGSIVCQQLMESSKISINMTTVAQGIYFINIGNGIDSYTKKFAKF